MYKELLSLSKQLGEILRSKNLKLALAESCTGGLAAEYITALPCSSAWFDCAFITYSNQSKERMLGVPAETLEKFGAVSEQTAIAMVKGALNNSQADIVASITGIAGPDGGSAEKPVGTVCFAWGGKDFVTTSSTQLLIGDRQIIRHQAAQHLMVNLIKILV
ncbi:MAG: CinA family protein [Methylotenera sp.]|nr:CinA family protein [Methylotenera sp.]